jgi:hypothetical protein
MIYKSRKASFNPLPPAQYDDGYKELARYTELAASARKGVVIAAGIAAFAAHLFTVVMSPILEFDTAVFVIYCFLLAADTLFLALSFFTNFRFRYAGRVVAVYLAVSFLLTAAIVTAGPIFNRHIFTVAGVSAISVTHVMLWAALIYSLHLTRKYNRRPRAAVLGLTAATTALAAFMLCVAFLGFFGQGGRLVGGERTVLYRLEQDDGGSYYVADGVLGGTGSRAVIADTFNGLRVKAINCGMFSSTGLDLVEIEGDTVPEFVNMAALSSINPNLSVQVAFEVIDELKEKLYEDDVFAELSGGRRRAFLSALVPKVEDDEIYVTFINDPDTTPPQLKQYIPTFKAKKGTAFRLTDLGLYYRELVENRLNLQWCYDTAKAYKHAIGELKYDGIPLIGSVINNSARVTVSFEKVYKLTMKKGDYAYLGAWTDTHYITKSRDSGIDFNPPRPGCRLTWMIKSASADFRQVGGSAAAVMSFASSQKSHDLTMKAVWTVKTPEIEEFKASATNNFVYGDNISLSSKAKAHELDLVFSILKNNSLIETGAAETYSLGVLTPEVAQYTLKVKATDIYDSNLYSEASRTITVTVAKKTLTFNWSVAGDLVYNGEERTINCDFDDSQLVGDDTLDYDYTLKKAKNAGSYTSNVVLSGDSAQKYIASAATASFSFTIQKKAVDVSWGATAFTYNGEVQAPTAAAVGVEVDGALALVVLGGQKNASASPYTASIDLDALDPNYSLNNPTVEFSVSPLAVSVVWGGTEFIYNGAEQAPTASAEGIPADGALPVTVSGAQKNASVFPYTATASTTNTNYALTGATAEFNIAPKTAAVVWGELEFTYNGYLQKPTAFIEGEGADGTIALTVSGGMKNASAEPYTATASTTNTNYTLMGETAAFTISRAAVAVVWGETEFVYNGMEQQPEASATGVGDDGALDLTVTGTGVNASATPYNASASTADTNYTLSSVEVEFLIKPREVEAVWGQTSFVYNGLEQKPTATAQGAASDGTLVLTVSGGQINASSAAYVATASTENTNYQIANATAEFTIAPKAVETVWGSAAFTYNGAEQKPAASADGIPADGALTVTVSGGQKNASASPYIATASTPNTNYTLLSNTKEFTISPCEVAVEWGETAFVYNGLTVKPSASATGVPAEGELALTITGGGKDASATPYTATASLADTNYTLTNATTEFTISPLEVAVVWGETSLIFNGLIQKPAASADGVPADGALTLEVSGGQINASSEPYTATASLADTNYTLTNDTTEFTISPLEVEIEWSAVEFFHDDAPHAPEITNELLGEVAYAYFANGGEIEYSALIETGVYTVIVTDLSGNYTFINAETEFKIVEP